MFSIILEIKEVEKNRIGQKIKDFIDINSDIPHQDSKKANL